MIKMEKSDFEDNVIYLEKIPIEKFVEQYLTFNKSSAQSILRVSETMVQAEEALGDGFDAFCNRVGIVKGSPTYSKHKTIGENAVRLEPYLDQMPGAWTTIYKLAKLPPDQFLMIARDLTPALTAADIDSLLSKPTAVPSEGHFRLGLIVPDMSNERLQELYERLQEIENAYGCEIRLGRDLSKRLNALDAAAGGAA